MMIILTQKS
uniref:Uncharacterized protein n=1 Tax=Rhizophora mucronata TaxID=61149 RepID=A0A2P2P8E4_RHIMU